MIKIYSNSEKNLLLHIIFRKIDFKKRQDIISPLEFIQVASLQLSKDQTFKAHMHKWKNKKIEKLIAQESWVVIQGKVKVQYYDINKNFLKDYILTPGDCTITLYGGHNYTSLTDETLVYEFKTGPYDGQSSDKDFLND